MLCPAVSDPFYGRGYRLCAMVHQMILIPVIGKFIVKTSYYFNLAPNVDVKETPVFVSDTKYQKVTERSIKTLSKMTDPHSTNGTACKGNNSTGNSQHNDNDEIICGSSSMSSDRKSTEDSVVHRNGVRHHIGETGGHIPEHDSSNNHTNEDLLLSGKDNSLRQGNGHAKQS